MLNWIVWNRTVYLYKNGFRLNNHLQRSDMPQNPNNKNKKNRKKSVSLSTEKNWLSSTELKCA